MITAEYAIDQSALEEHNLAITIRMPVHDWRRFLTRIDDTERETGVPYEVLELGQIFRRALAEYDKATSRIFDVGEYFAREKKAVDDGG